MSETASEAASFVDKWRTRWPEWGIARVFVPAPQRELAEHWFALLQEWTDAASTAEPAPGLAKLAWWQEELKGWAKGSRRHPLGALLQKQPLDWTMLAMTLPGLAQRDPVDDAALRALATAISEAERALFDEPRDASADIRAMLARVLGAVPAVDKAREGTRPRRILTALEQARTACGESPVSPWMTLRSSWRAARVQVPG